MAAFEQFFEDLFMPASRSDSLPMAAYEPAFGEEELVAFQAARPQIVGTTDTPMGPTGFYGRALGAAAAREAARSAASGNLAAGLRGRRERDIDVAAIKRKREALAADRATRLQQARLRGNVMGGVGGVAEGVRGAIEDPLFQKYLKGLSEGRAQERGAALDRLVEPQVQSMRDILAGSYTADAFAPTIGFSPEGPVTAQERMLSKFYLRDVPSLDLGGF